MFGLFKKKTDAENKAELERLKVKETSLKLNTQVKEKKKQLFKEEHPILMRLVNKAKETRKKSIKVNQSRMNNMENETPYWLK